MNKLTFKLQQHEPFASCPTLAELSPDRVRCNDVILPLEFNPNAVGLWIIGNAFGAVGAVWAGCEQGALDKLVDCGLGKCFLVSEVDQASATEEESEEWAHLGNAGEACDLSDAWMGRWEIDVKRDWQLLCAFAEARGACADTLDR